jgi:hypothetical protein
MTCIFKWRWMFFDSFWQAAVMAASSGVSAVHDEEFDGAVLVLAQHEGAQDRILELGAKHRAHRFRGGERLQRNAAQFIVEEERAVDGDGIGLVRLRLLPLQDAAADQVLQGARHIVGVELGALSQLAGRKLLIGCCVGDHQEFLHLGGEEEICGTHFFQVLCKGSALSGHAVPRFANAATRSSPWRFRDGFRRGAWRRPTAARGLRRLERMDTNTELAP